MSDDQSRKRKRVNGETKTNGLKSRKAPKTTLTSSTSQEDILVLEEQILQGRAHYNNIPKLQSRVDNADNKPKTATLAAVALCRVFCRLIAGEKLVKQREDNEADTQVVQWLKQRLRDYVESLTSWIGSPDASQESTALTLLMRVVKAETSQGSKRSEQAWKTEKSTFYSIVKTLLEQTDAEGARQEFVEKYVEEYDDVRFYTMLGIKHIFSSEDKRDGNVVGNALDLLKGIEGVPDSEEQLADWYGDEPSAPHQLLSLSAHRKTAQECWLCIFRSPLTLDQRTAILNIATPQILPWFPNKLEILTDFLTDSFDSPDRHIALLALSGIFHLMTHANIDYPDFYTKLYSLLDDKILHSQHRSRFFRLLDKFMSSSHLPAALVASFIKRLSRLSLQAPPGAIIWIVPWVYNMMKSHPACTFMLHRPYHPAHAIWASNPEYLEQGMGDPFLARSTDPFNTCAIDSSLWELQTLREHWHPNVATLAGILGEQFTKREYQLEDFLDHSYASLIEAELGKEIKRKVEVEWEIPKRIMTSEDGGFSALGGLLQKAVEA